MAASTANSSNAMNPFSTPGRPNHTPFAPVRPSPLGNSDGTADVLHKQYVHGELDDTASVATMNGAESDYERMHLLQQQPSVSSLSSTASHTRVPSGSAVPNEHGLQQRDAEHANGQESSASNRKPSLVRRKTEGSTKYKKRQPRVLFDSVDQLDITAGLYGTGLFHHESPYDCALPHRNASVDAPVHAFEYTDSPEHAVEERPTLPMNPMTSSAPRSGRVREINHPVYESSYRDSFLEGSPAHGVEISSFAARQNNRKSFFKRISTVGARIGGGGARRF